MPGCTWLPATSDPEVNSQGCERGFQVVHPLFCLLGTRIRLISCLIDTVSRRYSGKLELRAPKEVTIGEVRKLENGCDGVRVVTDKGSPFT